MLGNVDEKVNHKDTKYFSFLIIFALSYSPSKQSQHFHRGKACLKNSQTKSIN